MKLQQLLYLTRVIQYGLNISETARTLHTSQSGVSRYLGMLEEELGTQIFVREDNRLVALTTKGAEIARVARRMLDDAQMLRNIGRDGGHDELTIATAHTHARYVLPPIVKEFVDRHPGSRIRLRQGNLSEIVRWTVEGAADFMISSAPAEPVSSLALVPCRETHRIVIVPNGHPLLAAKSLTFESLAHFPFVAYDESFVMRAKLIESFREAGLELNIVLSASDSEVIKTYVRTGIGIAILSSAVFDAEQDVGLTAIDGRPLFGSQSIYMGFRRHDHLSESLLNFVRLYAPNVSVAALEAAVNRA